MTELEELKSLTREQIKKLDHDKLKVFCSVKNCWHFTRFRDFGMDPVYWHSGMRNAWFDIDRNCFICGKHWQIYKKRGPEAQKMEFKEGPSRMHIDNSGN